MDICAMSEVSTCCVCTPIRYFKRKKDFGPQDFRKTLSTIPNVGEWYKGANDESPNLEMVLQTGTFFHRYHARSSFFFLNISSALSVYFRHSDGTAYCKWKQKNEQMNSSPVLTRIQ
jgi:hypothetical protein